MTGVLFFLVLMTIAESFAFKDDLLVEDFANSDTAVVESTVREVRAAVPTNLKDLLASGTKIAYIHSYNDGDVGGNEKGYYKKGDDKGNDGYKHFDSYHKKDADKYGYETHSAFGKYAYDGSEAGEKKGKYTDGEGDKASYEDGQHNSEAEDGEETKTTYQVVEGVDDYEGDSDHYTAGDHGGSSEQYAEGGDDSSAYHDGDSYSLGHSEQYNDGGDSGDYKSGYDGANYGSEGHDGGISAYVYGGEGEGESEHYTAEDDSDY